MTIPTAKEPIDPDAIQPADYIYRPYPSDGNVIDDHLPTLGKPTGHEAEFEHNAEERCAVVLVLDTSNSMKGEPIELLNEAVKQFHRNLTDDPLIAIKVDIGMVTFNHNMIYTDFVNATEFNPPVMHASGGTKLSFALSVALDMVTKRKDVYRINGISYHRPWIVLITDGYPEHDSEVDLESAGQTRPRSGRQQRMFIVHHHLRRRQRNRWTDAEGQDHPTWQTPKENHRSQFQRTVQLAQQFHGCR